MTLQRLLKSRTFWIVIGFVALVIVQGAGVVLPEFVMPVLAALGLGFYRASIAAVSGNKGWKTYASALVIGALGVLQQFNIVFPYEIVYTITGAFGIVGVRDAHEKLKQGLG